MCLRNSTEVTRRCVPGFIVEKTPLPVNSFDLSKVDFSAHSCEMIILPVPRLGACAPGGWPRWLIPSEGGPTGSDQSR